MSTVTVVGVDGGPVDAAALAALADADLVLGSPSMLAAVELPEDARTAGPTELTALASAQRAVVLASGDPGFFGIVRLLREHGHQPVVRPARSSVSRAFAALGRGWDDVAVVSAHGRDLRAALNLCRSRRAVAVLTAPGAGAAEILAGLSGWRRSLVVAEDLGGPQERVRNYTGGPVADPHLVLCFADPASVPERGWLAGGATGRAWGLPESEYEHRDGMITKAEVRAQALAMLAPGPGRLVWDIGAGSGSVGIECARLGAAVIAVERDPGQCGRITANAVAHGVDVRLVFGQAPEAVAGLPEPDAVFIGGGGPDVVAMIARHAPLVVVTLAAIDRVGPCRASMLEAGLAVDGVQLSASRLAELPDGGVRLAATNPVMLLRGRR